MRTIHRVCASSKTFGSAESKGTEMLLTVTLRSSRMELAFEVLDDVRVSARISRASSFTVEDDLGLVGMATNEHRMGARSTAN